MKHIKSLMAACAAMLALTACTGSSDDNARKITIIEDFTNLSTDIFSSTGQWEDAYNTDINVIAISPFYFSHYAMTETTDGVTVKNFYGFVPAYSTEQNALAAWPDNQWACVAPNPNYLAGNSSYAYMLGYCDVLENPLVLPKNPKCCIAFEGRAIPREIYIANSVYGYEAMKNGSDFSRPFGPDAWCKVNITGYRDGKIVSTVSTYLAQNGEITKDWNKVDLSILGEVDGLYFTMESSDSGNMGMNNPAYFCVGRITAVFSTM